jgi:hypothetical protein
MENKKENDVLETFMQGLKKLPHDKWERMDDETITTEIKDELKVEIKCYYPSPIPSDLYIYKNGKLFNNFSDYNKITGLYLTIVKDKEKANLSELESIAKSI